MTPSLTHFRSYITRLSPYLTLVFLLLWLRTCIKETQQAHRHKTNLQAQESQLRHYRLTNGQLAREKQLLEVTAKELKDQVWLKDDSLQLLLKQLKDPVVTVKWKTRFIYDTLYIPFDSSIPQDFQRDFSKTTEWYFISGTANQNGINIDTLSIPNTQRLVVGYTKGNPVVKVTNSNPHLVTEAIEGQVIQVSKKPWVLGIGGTWNLYEPPSAGLFLGYKIFEF